MGGLSHVSSGPSRGQTFPPSHTDVPEEAPDPTAPSLIPLPTTARLTRHPQVPAACGPCSRWRLGPLALPSSPSHVTQLKGPVVETDGPPDPLSTKDLPGWGERSAWGRDSANAPLCRRVKEGWGRRRDGLEPRWPKLLSKGDLGYVTPLLKTLQGPQNGL